MKLGFPIPHSYRENIISSLQSNLTQGTLKMKRTRLPTITIIIGNNSKLLG